MRSTKQLDTLSLKTRNLEPLALGDSCRIQNQAGRFPIRNHRTTSRQRSIRGQNLWIKPRHLT